MNLFSRKKSIFILATILLIVSVLIFPKIAQADVAGFLANLTSQLLMQIIYVMGQLLLIAINILIKVASFNDFIGANIVTIGWTIVRDIANLAIVVALMVIAFYTALNSANYEYKKMLPKLIAAAILINFSKEITGFLIDIAQVVMMTFVHAFENIAAGNLTYGFGLQDLLSVRGQAQGAGVDVNDWSILGAFALAALMVLVALGVVVTMAIMLLARIVTLWLLVIFSPIAYVAGLIPGGKKHADEWWSTFNKNVIFGPVLAFLFWLSMTVLSQVTEQNRLVNLEMQATQYLQGGASATSQESYAYFASQVSSPQRVFDYMVTTALLIFCLIVAKRAGVTGAEVAGNFMNKLQGAGKWIQRRPGVWGRKGLERAKVSYAGAGVAALAQRARTSWAGKRLGFDKEYAETQAAKRRAIMTERLGGRRGEGAIRTWQYQQAMKKQKEMDERGQLEGGEDALRALLYSRIKAGKMDDARAVMLKMAGSKGANLKTDDLEKYREALGVVKNSGTQTERDYKLLMEELMAAQKASGDTMAEYKFGVQRDMAGNLGYIQNMAEKVKDNFEKKREADFNDTGIFKAFDETKPEFLEILNQLGQKTNMQALNSEGREGYAKILQRTIAKWANGDETIKGLVGGNIKIGADGGLEGNYVELLKKMKAKQFIRGTGEAVVEKKDERLSEKEKANVLKGLSEFNEMISTEKLKEVYNKVKGKEVEKGKKEAFFDLGVPGEFDEEVKEKIIRPLAQSREMAPKLYQLSSLIRKGDNRLAKIALGEVGGLVKNYGTSDILKPGSMEKYSGEEAFDNSMVGKKMKMLAENYGIDLKGGNYKLEAFEKLNEEQKKQAADLVESVMYDIENAIVPSFRPKNEQQKIKNSRIITKNSLGLISASLDKMITQGLSSSNRDKVVNGVLHSLDIAIEHATHWNKAGVNELKQMKEKAQGLREGKINFQDFKNEVGIVLNKYQTK